MVLTSLFCYKFVVTLWTFKGFSGIERGSVGFLVESEGFLLGEGFGTEAADELALVGLKIERTC